MNLARAAFFLLIATRTSAEIVIGLLGKTGDEGGFSLGAIFNIVALLIAAVALLYRSRATTKLPILIWAPYLVIAAGSLAYTPEFGESAKLLLSTLTFPAIFLAAAVLLRTQEDVANLFLCIIYSSFIPTLLAFYEIAAGGLASGRIQSTFAHPNIFAFYLVGVICAILYYNLVAHRRAPVLWRAFLFSYILVLLALLVVTQTRSAWLAMAVFIVIYAVGVDRKLLMFLPLAPLVLMVPVVSERLQDIGGNNHQVTFEELRSGEAVLNSYAWRQALWGRALADSEDARVLGKGLGTLGKNAMRFFPLAEDGRTTEAHSAYVQTIYELGVLGLLGYLMLYVGVIVAVFVYRRRAVRLAYIIIGFAVVNMIISYSDNLPYYLSYNWYVWAMFGADFALRFGVLKPAPVRRPKFVQAPVATMAAAQPR